MCCFDHTSNTINLVTATKYTDFWVIEHCVFMKDLVDCSVTTHGVIFAKYVAQITKQQGRYAVGHGLSPLVIKIPRKGNRPRCLAARIQGKLQAGGPPLTIFACTISTEGAPSLRFLQ